jgi:hypothetical protein
MCGEFRLTPEFYAVGVRVGTAAHGAFGDAAALKLRGDAKRGKHKLGNVRGRIDG